MEGDPGGAAAAARNAIAAAEDDHEGYMVLGEALIVSGQVDAGLSELRKALEVGEGHIWARSRLAWQLYGLGRLDEAAAEYRKVLDYVPDSPTALKNLGAIYLMRGNYVESIQLLKGLLDVQPDDFAASNLGTAYFYLDQLPESIAAYHQAVELAPDDPGHKQNLAEAYEKSGDTDAMTRWYAEALTAYDRLLILLGESGRTFGGSTAVSLAARAFCAARLGRFEEALRDVDVGLRRDPDDMVCLRFAARVHASAGNREQAYALIRRAVAAGYPPEELRRDFQVYHDDPAFLSLLTEPGF